MRTLAKLKPMHSVSPYLYKPETIQRFQGRLREAFDFHSFRRAYNTALAGANVKVQIAMRLAGHRSASTHMRYVLFTDELSGPAQALPVLLKAPPVPKLDLRRFDSPEPDRCPEKVERALRRRRTREQRRVWHGQDVAERPFWHSARLTGAQTASTPGHTQPAPIAEAAGT